jgi:hypothetical protein
MSRIEELKAFSRALWFGKKEVEEAPLFVGSSGPDIYEADKVVAFVASRPTKVSSMILYRIVAILDDNAFGHLNRYVKNRIRYGELNLDQREKINELSKEMIAKEEQYGIRN